MQTTHLNDRDILVVPTGPTGTARTIKILAGKLFDPYSKQVLLNRAIVVSSESGLILSVDEYDSSIDSPESRAESQGTDSVCELIDLRDQTVLPGLVDAHVHCKFASVPPTVYRLRLVVILVLR